MSTIQDKWTTLVTAIDPDELSPIEGGIMDAANIAHEARVAGDAESLEAVRAELEALLERYDATDGEDHPNPAWARPNQRALALSALGRVEEAVRLERVALRYADTPIRREISLGNLVDRCLRLERYEEAIAHFMAAWDVGSESTALLLSGAQALHLGGMAEEAERVFEALGHAHREITPGTELWAYLAFEERLREIAPASLALTELFERFDRTRGA